MFRRVYLDNSATTPVDPEVLDAMLPYLEGKFGNASSIHFFGQEARAAVDRARHQSAALINARPNEIVFTSGGTEANNLAIRGLFEARKGGAAEKAGRGHIITSAIEHSAVLDVCGDLEKSGLADVTRLPVYSDGIVRIEDVEAAVRDTTAIISVMTANNEIGTIQPIVQIGSLTRSMQKAGRKIYFHTDAVQAAGKIPLDVDAIGCDLLTFSAHKIYAPKGAGALYVRRGVRLRPQNIGGHQERERRGGTENVVGIVGMGAACVVARAELLPAAPSVAARRDRLEAGLLAIPGARRFGGGPRVCNTTNVGFAGVEGELVVINLDLDGISVSTGAACTSGSVAPSPVILGLGVPRDLAATATRFSLSPATTDEEIDVVLERVPAAVGRVRRLGRGAP